MCAFTIPNEADAFHADQAEPDKVDIDILVAGLNGAGVVSGCAVTAQGTPDMTCAVAAGVTRNADGTTATVAAGNVTITAANATNPRIDLVVVSSTGTKSVTAGTAAASPVMPAIPATSVVLAAVYVPANDTAIATNQITDKRVVLAVPSGFDLDTYTLDATYGDDFTAASLDAKWTRRNFAAGAESYQVGKVGTYIRIAMTGRVAGDGYFQTAPGGDWTFAMAHINRLHGEHTWGIGVLDSAGTGLGTDFADTGGSVYAFAALGITTYTTYSGVAQTTGSTVSLQPIYLRNRKVWQYLRKSGTDYFAAFSLDGETWSPETPAFSSAITVDRVGMIAHPQAALTTTAQVDVDWFNKIA